LKAPYTGSFFRVLGRLGVVLKNPGFASLLLTFSLVPMAMMAFIAASSYIYIQYFGSSEESFSLYFALNAVFAMIGPLIYMKLSNRFQSQIVIFVCFLTIAASGALVILVGYAHPALFALSVIPATTAGSLARPPTANLMLQQQDQDSGSASSLINFAAMVMGSLGIVLISGNWENLIVTLGALQLATGILSALLWWWLKNRRFIRFES
jgi:DHA1 family bicyclomycin/chloramphenicol resistance-like MFS transporter